MKNKIFTLVFFLALLFQTFAQSQSDSLIPETLKQAPLGMTWEKFLSLPTSENLVIFNLGIDGPINEKPDPKVPKDGLQNPFNPDETILYFFSDGGKLDSIILGRNVDSSGVEQFLARAKELFGNSPERRTDAAMPGDEIYFWKTPDRIIEAIISVDATKKKVTLSILSLDVVEELGLAPYAK